MINIDYFEIEDKLNTIYFENKKFNTESKSLSSINIQYDDFNDSEVNALFDNKIIFD